VREYLSNIEPEAYDEIYHHWVIVPKFPILVGQHTLNGDVLLYDNPESKLYTPRETVLEENVIQVIHGAQAEFMFTKPFSNAVKV
jgi:hypothetical protein